MRAITDEVVGFEMPGSIIPGFARKAVQMAKAGIYDLRIHHDEIVSRCSAVGHLRARGPRRGGERARQELAAARGARRQANRSWSSAPRRAAKGGAQA